jgi:hypothetical protein
VEFMEPVVHVAEGAEELEACFGEVEAGVEGVLVLLAFVDAGQLLGLGGELGRRARAASAVSRFELGEDGLELRVGDLLLQARDFGQSVQFAKAAGERGDLDVVLPLGLLFFDLGAERFRCSDLCLGTQGKVEKGNRDLDAKTNVVGSEVPIVITVAVQLVGVVVVDGAESELGPAPRQIVSLRLEQLGLPTDSAASMPGSLRGA